MLIGVIVPAYNVSSWIGDAIRSVMAQTHTDWVMTIVDDGSTDDTAAIAAGFNDPRIRLIRQPNHGVSAARNRGIAETAAGAVLLLDGDDWLAPHALAVLAAVLVENPLAVAAVGAYAKGSLPIRRPSQGDLLRALLVRNQFANGGHLLIRRTALDAAGWFLTHLRFGEDWEYWIRLALLGPFAATRGRTPVLFVRERMGGASLTMAARPDAYEPCMEAIFSSPGLGATRLGATRLAATLGAEEVARLRRLAEAENNWIVGRELIRHRKVEDGLRFLRRSVRARPSSRRLTLLALATCRITSIGPFHPYPMLALADARGVMPEG